MTSRGAEGPLGIAGKLAAIVGSLLVVFLLSGTALVYQAIDLGRADPQREALILNRRDSFKTLVEANEKTAAWEGILLAGSDSALRQTRIQNFEEVHATLDQLVAKMISRAANDQVRVEFQKFATAHEAVDTQYDKALAALVASNGKNVAAADAALRDAEVPHITALEDFNDQIDQMVLAETAKHVAAVDARLTGIVIAGLTLLVLLTVAMAVVVRRVVRPIRQLTEAARRAASTELPAAVAQINAMRDDDAPPTLTPILITSRDETASLAQAFDSIQTSALDLALKQHHAERESAEMLVNLGRRNQNLLNRTLAYITELERSEQDPEVLDRLFRLDHATTRIRRNAESMLVLAGARQTRTWSTPASSADVVRASLSEIEDYSRVDIYHMQDVAISGGAIADVVHLLAEVFENATNFSPPSTRVTVVGQNVTGGYRIRVIDEGIGMTRRELEEANQTIRSAGEGGNNSKLLGLYVVGRIAARRGIEVALEASGGRGITANVVLPAALLSDLPNSPQEQSPPRPESAPSRQEQRGSRQEHLTSTITMPRPVEATQPPYEPPAPYELPAPYQPPAPYPPSASPSHAPSAYAPSPRPTPEPEPAGHSRWAPAAGEGSPAEGVPADRNGQPPRPANVLPGLVQRVRGAQLPDLGMGFEDDPTLGSIDAGDVRGRLSSLQAGLKAGRAATGQPSEPTGAIPAVESANADQGDPTAAADEATGQPAPSRQSAPLGHPQIPIRVRGAQLPDLGVVDEDFDTFLEPASAASRWKLRSFQLDVDAARRNGAEHPGTEEPRTTGRGTPEES